MSTHNIDKIISYVLKTVDEHKKAPGAYARWLLQDANGTHNLEPSEYGCADAANILYTLGFFPRDLEERAASVAVLRSFQKPDGRFEEPTHHTLHTTAHCVAALELFDAAPDIPLRYHMENFGTIDKFVSFLEAGDWGHDVWQSHKGAGPYAAMAICCDMPLEWHDAYFNFFTERVNKKTGVNIEGADDENKNALFHLASWFHMMFNFSYAHRAFPNAERCVDSMIDFICNKRGPRFGKVMSFNEVDWIYLINRASMQTGYRREEAKEHMRNFAKDYIAYLEEDIENLYKEKFDDLHALFGMTCALAELQLALPGEIKSTVPLKNVLDRRPFI